MVRVIVSDIDGTILKDNKPIDQMVELLKVDQQKYLIVFLTAREQCQADSTFETLVDLFGGGFRLICVGLKNARQKKIYEIRNISEQCDIILYIDDDTTMIKEISNDGIPTLHVRGFN